jgi:hypothetical protein
LFAFNFCFAETRELNATFGTSLLLANSPMSPKIVNGTHAAICDYEQVLTSCAQTFAQLKMEHKDSPGKVSFRLLIGVHISHITIYMILLMFYPRRGISDI